MGMGSSVFHPDWIYHHRPVSDSAALATVLVVRNTGAEPEYNFETGTYDGATTTEVYRGRARIQKWAFPTNRDFVQDQVKLQRMRVQLPFNGNEINPTAAYDIHVNDVIHVLDNPSDPTKVGESYYVHGTESSSNAWNRTMVVQSNMKQVGV